MMTHCPYRTSATSSAVFQHAKFFADDDQGTLSYEGMLAKHELLNIRGTDIKARAILKIMQDNGHPPTAQSIAS